MQPHRVTTKIKIQASLKFLGNFRENLPQITPFSIYFFLICPGYFSPRNGAFQLNKKLTTVSNLQEKNKITILQLKKEIKSTMYFIWQYSNLPYSIIFISALSCTYTSLITSYVY
jgi:hypothetical protein